jgi:AraC-like DNA-binding protein
MVNCSLDLYHSTIREAYSYTEDHCHGGFELVYYETGSGTTQLNKQSHAYHAGQFAIILPNCRHNELRSSETSVRYLVFSYNCPSIFLHGGMYDDSSDGRVLCILNRLAGELQDKLSHFDIKLSCILMELIIEVSRMSGEVGEREVNEQLFYARHYIEQYYYEKINLQGLAETLGYSYDHFRHQFKAYTGYSPIQYVIRQRIDQAKMILIESDCPVTDISMDCGFSTPPQFCMLFKKHVGVSPTRFRQMYESSNGLGQELTG